MNIPSIRLESKVLRWEIEYSTKSEPDVSVYVVFSEVAQQKITLVSIILVEKCGQLGNRSPELSASRFRVCCCGAYGSMVPGGLLC